MTDQIRVFSYGGGVQSTAALVLAARGEIDFRTFIFANVGEDSENPRTLEYIAEHAKPYAERHGLELVEVRRTKRDGTMPTLFERLRDDERSIHIPMYSGDGGPLARNCTSGWKVRVIARWLKKQGATPESPAIMALGISLDEFYRMKTDSRIPWQVLAYPLVDLRVTRRDCVQIILSAGLPVPPKSSCWFCPFHRMAEWRKLRKDNPALFQKAVDLEKRLQERAQIIGHRQTIWLTTARRPLAEAVGNAIQLDFDDLDADDMGNCESGYCMT